MTAVQIKMLSPESLSIKWDDGHDSLITLLTLRDHCPCAGCQGETILLKTYKPEPRLKLAGMYNLSGIQQVGHYAIQISWADGHVTGIYSWKLLRELCECQICMNQK
jgi:prepilin-type processing-associated H-X9-DG protein